MSKLRVVLGIYICVVGASIMLNGSLSLTPERTDHRAPYGVYRTP